MGRKKIIKIPNSYTILCPICNKKSRIKIINKEQSFQTFKCKKCKQIIKAPITYCCILCAYSSKKCPVNLLLEANAKKLEISYN